MQVVPVPGTTRHPSSTCALAHGSVGCRDTGRSEIPEEGRIGMASSGKKKTTFAKLAREQKLRERRRDKQAKKDARKRTIEIDPEPSRNTMPPGGDQ
jgi:hypothetical protein